MLTYAANVTIPSANRLGGCGSGVRAGHLLISSFDPWLQNVNPELLSDASPYI